MLVYGEDKGNPALEDMPEKLLTVTEKHYLELFYSQQALFDEIRRLNGDREVLPHVA